MIEKVDLQTLEERVDALVKMCHQLAKENKLLRENQAHLMAERADLMEKNALACSRIEMMIARLKSMEADISDTSN